MAESVQMEIEGKNVTRRSEVEIGVKMKSRIGVGGACTDGNRGKEKKIRM